MELGPFLIERGLPVIQLGFGGVQLVRTRGQRRLRSLDLLFTGADLALGTGDLGIQLLLIGTDLLIGLGNLRFGGSQLVLGIDQLLLRRVNFLLTAGNLGVGLLFDRGQPLLRLILQQGLELVLMGIQQLGVLAGIGINALRVFERQAGQHVVIGPEGLFGNDPEALQAAGPGSRLAHVHVRNQLR